METGLAIYFQKQSDYRAEYQNNKMECDNLSEDLKLIVDKLMKQKRISNYKIEIEGQSAAGDNYLGHIIFFKVVSENNQKTFNLVMKTAQRSEELRKTAPIASAYNREMHMYFEVFPAFRRIIHDFNPSFIFDFVPTVYFKDTDKNKETIVLANMKSAGYKLYERRKPWNLEHSLVAMNYYGKYHALSLIIRDKDPETFKNLMKKNMRDYGHEYCVDPKDYYKLHMRNICELLRQNGRQDLAEKYDGFENGLKTIISVNTEECDKLVIRHGDCWNNNYMFKYEGADESKPIKMCFLDFQEALLDTPVYDLSYNIYSTGDKFCLDNLDLLLETYYASLSETVRSFGSDSEKLFTYEQLKTQWKKYAKFGVLVCIVIFKIQLAEMSEVPNTNDSCDDGIKFIEKLVSFEVGARDEYNRRILDVFTHFGDRFL